MPRESSCCSGPKAWACAGEGSGSAKAAWTAQLGPWLHLRGCDVLSFGKSDATRRGEVNQADRRAFCDLYIEAVELWTLTTPLYDAHDATHSTLPHPHALCTNCNIHHCSARMNLQLSRDYILRHTLAPEAAALGVTLGAHFFLALDAASTIRGRGVGLGSLSLLTSSRRK